ncbi:unnamed protein product [Diamesa tonsa]
MEEYRNLELACENKYCLSDANRLLVAATQNASIEPCDDFLTFTMEEFIKYGALHDRYPSVGFQGEVLRMLKLRQRKVVAAVITPNDSRPLKIAKNFFKNCVNSNNVRTNGTKGIISYMKSLGGSPHLSGWDLWNETQFNLETIFHEEAFHAVWIFTDHLFKRCNDPRNESLEILCLGKNYYWSYNDYGKEDTVEMLKELKISSELIDVTADKLYQYYLDKIPIEFESFENFDTKIIQIKDFKSLFPSSKLNINWLKIFNQQLTKKSQATEDSEVLIKDPNSFVKLFELMESKDKKTIADVFMTAFMQNHKEAFIVPALDALYAKKYRKPEIQKAAELFAREVVEDVIEKIRETSVNTTVLDDVIEQLRNLNYVMGFPEEILDDSKMDEFYEELDLVGSEDLVTTYLAIEKHFKTIENEPKDDWKQKLDHLMKEQSVKNVLEDKILFVPAYQLHFPWYHPDRTRFFNTATLFMEIMTALGRGVEIFANQKWNESIGINFNNPEFGYNNFVKYKSAGGKDLSLAGFRLTTSQLYWITSAHKFYNKYQPKVPSDYSPVHRLQNKFLHIYYKVSPIFREVFNCSGLNANDRAIYAELNAIFEADEKN